MPSRNWQRAFVAHLERTSFRLAVCKVTEELSHCNSKMSAMLTFSHFLTLIRNVKQRKTSPYRSTNFRGKRSAKSHRENQTSFAMTTHSVITRSAATTMDLGSWRQYVSVFLSSMMTTWHLLFRNVALRHPMRNRLRKARWCHQRRRRHQRRKRKRRAASSLEAERPTTLPTEVMKSAMTVAVLRPGKQRSAATFLSHWDTLDCVGVRASKQKTH